MSKNKVLAILVSDIHLSQTPPSNRTQKPAWFTVMKFYLDQLSKLSIENNCPVICAGDLFDRWDPQPELINFAIENLPSWFISVPGQHDLPNNSYDEMHRSAYGTLVKAKRITNLEPGKPKCVRDPLKLYGFPWGTPLENLHCQKTKDLIRIAVVHKYVWKGTDRHPEAKDSENVSSFSGKLKGFDLAVVGDNHKTFLHRSDAFSNKPIVYNCGTFMRRTTPEIYYHPSVGLLYRNGNVKPHLLDDTIDNFLNIEKEPDKTELSVLKEWIATLTQAIVSDQNSSIDIVEELHRKIESGNISKETQKCILEALDASRD